MNKYISFIIVIIIVILGVWFFMKKNKEPVYPVPVNQESNQVLPTNTNVDNTTNNTKNMPPETTQQTTTATLNTNMGNITIEFYAKDAPKTVANFTKLAKSGFYDGVKFHRVIKGFMIQSGDPLTKDDSKIDMWGTGGPGYAFADEINPNSALYKTGYLKGVVAMANSGPNTNGSQFFIMNADYPLPPLYTIFGHVVSGQDVVDKIALVKTVDPGLKDRPVDPVIINSITLK